MKLEKYYKHILILILSILDTIIMFNINIKNIFVINNLKYIIITILLYLFYNKFLNKNKFNKTILIISIILSSFLIMGSAIDKTSTIDILFSSLSNIIYTTISLLFYIILIYTFIFNLYQYLDNIKIKESHNKLYNFIFEKHPFIIPFLIIFIIGLPIILYFYPGTIQWDGMKQLDYFFGIKNWSNHHPAFSTFLMGICVDIGRNLGSDNLGVFIYTFTQYIISCLTFAYIIKFLKELNTPKLFRIITLIYFIALPIWYINSYTLVKDTMYYLIFIYFFIFLIKYFYQTNRKNYIILLLSSILLVLFRNNGIYVVLITFLFLLFNKKEKINKKKNISLILIIIIIQIIYSITLSIFNISGGNIREMLSIPIQQTARYVSNYSVNNEEKEIIENVFNADINTIKKKYNPEISDPVKFMFNLENKNELLDYFQIWIKQFTKHPKIYFDSFLQNYYGYFYPNKKEVKDGIAWFSIIKNKRVNTNYFNFYMNDKYENQRNDIENYTYYLRSLPIISLLFNTGFYTWILIILIGYIITKKQYNYLIISMPLLITLLFCFLSPVNSYIRYMEPIMVSLPIFIGLILNNFKNNCNTKISMI